MIFSLISLIIVELTDEYLISIPMIKLELFAVYLYMSEVAELANFDLNISIYPTLYVLAFGYFNTKALFKAEFNTELNVIHIKNIFIFYLIADKDVEKMHESPQALGY